MHEKVNHSIEFKNANGYYTNTIEGSWRHLKRSLPINLRPGNYENYVAEFLWRKVNRGNDLFVAFMQDIAFFYEVLRQ